MTDKIGEKKNGKKKLLLMLLLLLLLAGAVWFIFFRKSLRTDSEKTDTGTNQNTQNAETKDRGDLETLQIYAGEKTLRFQGYPYSGTQYYPKLFTIVYVGMASDEANIASLSDPIKNNPISYFASRTANRLYIPLITENNGTPYWQTMEVMTSVQVDEAMKGCTASNYALESLSAQAYDCRTSSIVLDYADSVSCVVKLTDTEYLVYRQHVTGGDNMCDTLKDNGITAVSLLES